MRRAALLLVVGILGPAAAPGPAAAAEPKEIVLDRDDIDVTESVVVRPGAYRVVDAAGDGVLRVRAAGVTVVLDGVTLDGARPGQEPDAFDGVGVSVEGAEGATVRGGAVRGYRVGLRGASSPRLSVSGIDASGNRKQRLGSTPEREDSSDWLWPHENDDGQWERTYGAGISLTACPGAKVTGCRVRGGQNGLLLTRCDGAVASDNDFSFDSGWGVAMYRSSGCAVLRNRCDWCVRGYSHGVYARGQDSAGILVFEQCSDNRFEGNSATHSGDGLFLYAGNETLKKTGAGGCNRNRVVGNDFSHAVANAIEATFSEGNELAFNLLDDSDHGVWAGYSRSTRIAQNRIVGCANGVSIEHGTDNRIEANRIADCRLGVHLWWDDDRDLLGSAYGKAQDTASARNVVVGNDLEAGVAVRLVRDTGSQVRWNRLTGRERAVHLGDGTQAVVERNAVGDAAGPAGPAAAAVEVAASARVVWRHNASRLPPRVVGESPLPPPGAVDAPAGADAPGDRPLVDRPPAATGVRLPEGAPRGRRFILVDDWGPVDPSRPTVFPKTQAAVGAAAVHVLAPGLPWKVTTLTEGFVAEPAQGTAPATLRVRAKAGGAAAAFAPFEATIRVGETDLVASGTVLSARWTVRFWPWTKDPREDAAAYASLLASPPAATVETAGLDFAWGGAAPHAAVPADRFVTVASATLTLPPGTWRLRTLSDDGVRVKVDGRVVLEDWTWHASKEDRVDVDLAAGPHEVVVEHFELDGWAGLRLTVEPLDRGR